jgi:hypothetical protein
MAKYFAALCVLAFCLSCACTESSRKESPSLAPQLSKEEKLADCLTAKGVTLYTTTWCGFCGKQKALFGKAVTRLTIIECDVEPNGPKCEEKGIGAIPAWAFPNGLLAEGVQSLPVLAEISGCPWSP